MGPEMYGDYKNFLGFGQDRGDMLVFLSSMSLLNKTTYLIIGGGIAGTTAAETIRKYDSEGSITIVSDEPHRLYSRILLSKPGFFLGEIPRERIFLRKENWYKQKDIHFLPGKKAVSLHPQKQKITLDDGQKILYQKLLLATGGSPKKWVVPGADKKGIHFLQTLHQAEKIIGSLSKIKRAVVVGGGFVSFELCDLLRKAGKEVVLITRRLQFWGSVFHEQGSTLILQAIKKAGVQVILQTEVICVEGEDSVTSVVCANGQSLSCDAIFVGIGMEYETGWLNEAGIKTGSGICTDAFLQTSLPSVWAAGDIAKFDDVLMGESVQYGNWVNAQRQGEYVGRMMTKQTTEPFRCVSSYTSSGFGLHLSFVGDIRREGREIISENGIDGSYKQLFLKQNILVGSVLINRVKDIGEMVQAIEQRKNFNK